MFKIAVKKTVTWPVTVNIPQDGGKTSKQTFTAEFEWKTAEETQAIVTAQDDLLDQVLTGWKGVAGEDNAELPFSDENKKALLGIPYVRAALFQAYGEIQQGREAARKN